MESGCCTHRISTLRLSHSALHSKYSSGLHQHHHHILQGFVKTKRRKISLWAFSNQKCFFFFFPIPHSAYTSLSSTPFFCSLWLWYDISFHADSLEHHRETTRGVGEKKKICHHLSKRCQVPPNSCQSTAELWSTDACDLYSVSSRKVLKIHCAVWHWGKN